jgi:hypothetical protein
MRIILTLLTYLQAIFHPMWDSLTAPLTPSTIGLGAWIKMVGGPIMETIQQVTQQILEDTLIPC